MPNVRRRDLVELHSPIFPFPPLPNVRCEEPDRDDLDETEDDDDDGWTQSYLCRAPRRRGIGPAAS